MKRVFAVLLLCAAVASASVTEAVEFPYSQFPRQLWERELVWLKNIGIRTIRIPESGDPNLRAVLEALLRRLDLAILGPGITGTRVSALAANSTARAREEIVSGAKTIIWTDVETTLTPALKPGAVSFAGDDLVSLNSLRRDAKLAEYWAPLLDRVEGVSTVKGLPASLRASQLTGNDASALLLVNRAAKPWLGELRVTLPSARKTLQLPPVTVPAGDSLWLPVDLPLAPGAFCRQCSAFGNGDRLVYATLELTAMEFENGTLAMEFYAPVAGEAVLQIAKNPSGPYLAGGKLKSFDWDNTANRARILIPPGPAPTFRTRVALAIEAPEQSAFFVDAKRLMIGEKNRILTSYSSQDLAKRSRLKLPAGWTAAPKIISPLEIEYQVDVPATLVNGDHVEFALEADGVEMGRARMQVLRPVSVRVRENSALHFSKGQELPVDPALVPVEEPAGRTINLVLRNASAEIRTYKVDVSAPGMEFSPATQEVVMGAMAEREVPVRIFGRSMPAGVVNGMIRISGASSATQAVRFVGIPRGQAVRYEAQLDGVGGPEFVIESSRVRAVFTDPQGTAWRELVWKESNRNVLADGGTPLGITQIELNDNALVLTPGAPAARFQKFSDVETSVQTAGGRTIYTLTRPAK